MHSPADGHETACSVSFVMPGFGTPLRTCQLHAPPLFGCVPRRIMFSVPLVPDFDEPTAMHSFCVPLVQAIPRTKL